MYNIFSKLSEFNWFKRQNDFNSYTHHEIANINRKLRFLISENEYYKKVMEQTRSSFNYQWGNLEEGEYLVTNKKFLSSIGDTISKYTQFEKEWFKDKSILDAGCGNGRFSFGFAQLGANVTSFDQSEYGTKYLKELTKKSNFSNVNIFQQNILKPIELDKKFDLVWSYGVLHHTGDTYKAFKNIEPLVKPGGHLFLMLYGEPRVGSRKDVTELNNYERLRLKTANLNFEDKVKVLEEEPIVKDVHGWFDAISPEINDLYQFEEIERWLLSHGYKNIKQTLNSRNLHIIAQKK